MKELHPVLAVTSHFFEFECQKSGEIYLPDQLVKGRLYEVILSTGNGFMRYRTNDIVEVTGHFFSTPTLVFQGRKNKK